jgi:chromosome segregation ATPase
VATIDELEHRMRFVGADIASEKEFARAQLQQSVRNAALLNTLKTRLDEVAADLVAVNAEVRTHSTLLPILQQDIGGVRNEVTALRRGQEELHARIDEVQREQAAMREEMNRKLDALLAAVRGTPPA